MFALKDAGLITDLDKTYVIDKNKLWREREKYSNIISEEAIFYRFIDGIYIDGRKDATLLTEHYAQTGKYYHKTELQEHVVFGEPGAYYLTHVSTQDGRGITIANEVYDAIKGTKLSDTLKVVETYGTASMTGKKAGFIRCLEEKLGKPLQWVVCLLHCSELHLRHVFFELDGTKSPDNFSGPVGKKAEWKNINFASENFWTNQKCKFSKIAWWFCGWS